MEFHETLQTLRKQRGLTQEQLAESLFVSRTAVSKWESGRGYPSIDSLKAIAAFFSVTVDELLSGPPAPAKENRGQTRRLLFALLDLCAAAFFFLPLLRQTSGGVVSAVSLPALTESAPYLRAAYLLIISGMTAWAVLSLALRTSLRTRPQLCLSLLLNAAAVLLFIAGSQPYGAAFLFLLLGIKVILLTHRQ